MPEVLPVTVPEDLPFAKRIGFAGLSAASRRRVAWPDSVRRPFWVFQVSVSTKSILETDAADSARGPVSSLDASEERGLAVLHPIDEAFVELAGAAGVAERPHHGLVVAVSVEISVDDLLDFKERPFQVGPGLALEPASGHLDRHVRFARLEVRAGRTVREAAEVDLVDVGGWGGRQKEHHHGKVEHGQVRGL
jgi:hypothetical protein